MNMTYIYPLYIYSYFIYNKYYNIYNHTKYYKTFFILGYEDFKINETKIFNPSFSHAKKSVYFSY